MAVPLRSSFGRGCDTVKKSLLRIFDKVGVSNRVELVLYALTQREIKTHEVGVPTAAVSLKEHGPLKTVTTDGHEGRNAPTTQEVRPVD